jgi:hypothetical protein
VLPFIGEQERGDQTAEQRASVAGDAGEVRDPATPRIM